MFTPVFITCSSVEILSSNNTRWRLMGGGLGVGAGLMVRAWDDPSVTNILLVSFFLPALVYFIYRYIYRQTSCAHIDHYISISSGRITVDKQTFQVSDLTNLSVLYHSYQGQLIYIPGCRGRQESGGDDNILSFCKGEEKFEFTFTIYSQEHKQALANIIASWYTERLKFFEGTVGKTRTYCLDGLSYKELQNFKSKFGISSVFPMAYDPIN
jgi:hypothetical protein